MTNYAPRYAALCEKWPELRIEENDSTLLVVNDKWSVPEFIWKKSGNTCDFATVHKTYALALIRAKLEDGLPEGSAIMKTPRGRWMIETPFKDGAGEGYAALLPKDTALDALLAWWEGRKA